MTTELTEVASERSTYVVTVVFRDEEGTTVTPNAATWTLTNSDEEVVNNRLQVPIVQLSSTVDIILEGDDLDYEDGPSRTLVVEAEYDSSLGSDLPLKQQATFNLEDLRHV